MVADRTRDRSVRLPNPSLDELRKRAQGKLSDATRAALLRDVISAHEGVAADGDDGAALRRVFIEVLDADLEEDRERFGHFLAEHVQPTDFVAIEVESPDQAVRLFRMLSRFRYDTDDRAKQLQRHVEGLLKSALQRFESLGDLERMFRLLQVAPPTNPADPELVRLRGRAHLYEMTRARWRRRALYVYLLAQIVLVTVVFPLLFINAENGWIQARLDEAVHIDVDETSDRQFLSYTDGLYWSMITASSIGYGDITPRTNVGRMIAAILGTIGVITVGVLAGLILYWLTPRKME